MADVVRVDTSELTHVLYELRGRAKNLRRVLPALAQGLVAGVDDVFDAEGPDWEPLKESTRRARIDPSAKILQDTGVAVASVGAATGSDWAEARGGDAILEFHATGTSRMPQRNPFDLGPFEEDFLEDAADLVANEVVR